MSEILQIWGTGHRPNKLGGYSAEAQQRLDAFAVFAVGKMIPLRPQFRLILGMAQGWDQALAVAAVHHSIPFVACIPFEGQASIWPALAQARWSSLRKAASAEWVGTLQGDDFRSALLTRNEQMADLGSECWALWNGTSGGTSHGVAQARTRNQKVCNFWSRWKEFESGQLNLL